MSTLVKRINMRLDKINKIIEDIKTYWEYMRFAVKSELKAQLASTYFGWFWWILDPLMYMLIYILVVSVIMNKGKENFPIFVFSALLSWKWTSGALMDSTKSIKSKIRMLEQIYLPKMVLVMIKVVVNTVKYLIGIGVLILLIFLYKIPFTVHILEFAFVFATNFMMILGISCFLAHMGIYFRDISNVLAFSLRLWFYVSPGIYSVSDVPQSIRWIWYLNPMTYIYEGYRNVFLHGKSPAYGPLLIWFCVFSLLSILGGICLKNHDRKYIKVS